MPFINTLHALEQGSITFTPEMRDDLRVQYNNAVEQEIDPFLFDGNEYVLNYAKYLLEYLDMKFPIPAEG